MIRVLPQSEPDDFEKNVRQPGLKAIADGKKPLPAFWRKALPDLWKAYNGICSYLCVYIPKGVGGKTVDHYVAKSQEPSQIYEWSNYRLACALMNSRKRAFNDVLDPFEVETGWFVLILPTMHVKPSSEIPEDVRRKVADTISRLKLNDKECRDARSEHFNFFLKLKQQGIAEDIAFSFLEEKSPFVAWEYRRQSQS